MTTSNELTTESDWDTSWEVYQPEVIQDNDQILGKNGAFLKTLEKRFKIKNSSSVLELGGACSAYLCSLAKFKNANASVIDYSQVGLSKTKKLFELNGCEVDIYNGDFSKYDFGGKKFDYIVHWGLIEHFKNPIDIFTLSANLLNPSGVTIFTMPNMEAYGVNLWKKYDADDFNTHIFHSDEYIHQLALASGFKVNAIYYWGPPLYFNAGYWFHDRSFLKHLINFFIRLLSLLSRIFPIFNIGHKKVYDHRAFILSKN